MLLVIDENRVVKSIWSGDPAGVKKKAEYTIIEAPDDWVGTEGDLIDEFEEDWSPTFEYLKRRNAKERENRLKLSKGRRIERAIGELKRTFDTECRILDKLESEDDPKAYAKCQKWLTRMEREINAVYDTDFHLTMDKPIEEQLNFEAGKRAFAKDEKGRWKLRELDLEEKSDSESIVLEESLDEEEADSYCQAVNRDEEAERFESMTAEEKEQEKERELDSLADEIAREERKAQIRGKSYDAQKEFKKRSKEIEENYR